MQKIVIKVKKPKNMLVALALFRKAGSHNKSNKAKRKAIKDSLRGEIESRILRGQE